MEYKNNVVFKIDLDYMRTRQAERLIKFRINWIDYYFHILPAKVSYYRTHKGMHVYIMPMNEVNLPLEYITFIQLALGSDWLREIRNLNRLYTGTITNWNLLFNKKFKMNKDGTIENISKEIFVKRYVIKPQKR
ncbi:MAG: hypothetical protein QXH07_04220 [Thermoplasmata archaeon]